MQKPAFSLKGIRADEMRFALSGARITKDMKFDLKPSFSRQVRKTVGNEKMFFVSLEVKIESSEESPKPFNLKARFVGVFEVNNMTTDEDKRTFAINATETMFPYLRAAVTNLTADALINPLTLPVVPGSTLFPEDRGPNHYTLNFDPKVVN